MSITGDILGKYSLNTYIAVIEAVLLSIYLAVLGFKLKKRSIFPLRFAVSFFYRAVSVPAFRYNAN